MNNNPNRLRSVFAVIGAPSCAKGTGVELVFKNFCEKAGITMAVVPVSQHLSRHVNEMKDRGLAEQIKDDMEAGRLVCDEITNAVFSAAVDEVASQHTNMEEPLMVVLDGAPRTPKQVTHTIFSVTNTLNVSISEFNVVHVSTPPHICAYRMGLRGRKDDLCEKVVATRFKEYFEKTVPAIQLLRKFGSDSTSDSRFLEIDGRFMRDEAYSYQQKIFGPLWPEFFPGICRKIPFVV